MIRPGPEAVRLEGRIETEFPPETGEQVGFAFVFRFESSQNPGFAFIISNANDDSIADLGLVRASPLQPFGSLRDAIMVSHQQDPVDLFLLIPPSFEQLKHPLRVGAVKLTSPVPQLSPESG